MMGDLTDLSIVKSDSDACERIANMPLRDFKIAVHRCTQQDIVLLSLVMIRCNAKLKSVYCTLYST